MIHDKGKSSDDQRQWPMNDETHYGIPIIGTLVIALIVVCLIFIYWRCNI